MNLLAEKPDSVADVWQIACYALAGAVGVEAGIIWKLVMMGRSDIIALIPVLKENNEVLKEVKELLK